MSRHAAALRRGLPWADVAALTDRRFRRPDARPARRRWRRLAWRAAGISALAAAGVALLALAGAWLGRTGLLAVDQFVVRGTSRLSERDVDALLDGVRGQNLLRVDFDDCRRRLMSSPWVAGATLARELPSTLRVDVIERVPIAIARLNTRLYLVDGDGVLIDDYGPEYREFDLPIVDGLVRTTGEAAQVEPTGVQAVARFLAALGAAPDLQRRVSQIDASDPSDLVVLLGDDAARLHVGDARFVERLSDYELVAPTLRGQLKPADAVDLRYDPRMYVLPRGPAR